MAQAAVLQPTEVKVYYPYPIFVYPGQPLPALPLPSTVPPNFPLPPLSDVQRIGGNKNTTVRNLWFPPSSASSTTARGASTTSTNGANSNDNRNTKQATKSLKRKAPPIPAPASMPPVAPVQKRLAMEKASTPDSTTAAAAPAASALASKTPAAAASTPVASNESSISVTIASTKPPAVARVPPVSFEERYKQLVHFQKGFGHCRVTDSYKEVAGLGGWVSRLRIIYKDYKKYQDYKASTTPPYLVPYYGKLTQEQVDKLNQIGFEFSVGKPVTNLVPWSQRLLQLEAYKEEHGHCNVPRAYKKVKGLGEWVHTQRTAYRDKTKRMMEYYAPMLLDIGFTFQSSRVKPDWEGRIKQLVEFRRQNGHLNVPKLAKKGSKEFVVLDSIADGEVSADGTATGNTGLPLGQGNALSFCRWVKVIRTSYWRKWKRNIVCTLNKRRVKQLEDLGGFDWGPECNGQGQRKTVPRDPDEDDSSQYESANEEEEDGYQEGARVGGQYGRHGYAHGHGPERGMI